MSQAGHAIAEYVLKCPGLWDNDTLVILDAPKGMILEAIDRGAIGFQDCYFKEPRAAAFKEIPSLDTSDLALAR